MKQLFATLSAAAAVLLALPATTQAAGLTPLEQRWIAGMTPVLMQARSDGMPVDVVVQPQDAPDAAPLALGFRDGRCKLVLSLRGNPEGEATLTRLPEGLEAEALELMAAHELGHCRRYLDGAWFALPAGFAAARVPEGLSEDLRRAYLSMKSTRREEGYGDLVALAWTARRHPARYAALHAWLSAERARDLLPGSHHDTLAWLALARDPAALATTDAAPSMFTAAASLWARALDRDE
ncbi:hypothetical protein [Roseateles chitosanitabidus]|uniref:hypothetical protein n=1 Tax=Roseateles chitosanitabidus TaxID=65048 RepID=UPI0008374342|nr:hypothetical protein [Roseateles chitosanitabidus]